MNRVRASHPASRKDPSAEIAILLEEYRQMYELARLRLNALDRRTPTAAFAFAIALGGISAAETQLQMVLLVAVPLSLVWWLKGTITAARSFEDALRRIEQIEHGVNQRAQQNLLCFQSSHPARSVFVGGRTGEETIQSVLACSAVVLGSCLYLSEPVPVESLWIQVSYPLVVASVTAVLLFLHRRLRHYVYLPPATDVESNK